MATADQWMAAIGEAEKNEDFDAAQQLRDEAQKDLTGGASILANVGAGMKSLGRGAQQLVGMGPGDEVIREERRIADIAAPTMAGKVAQFAGEVAPGFAVPGGVGARVLGRALQGGNVARMTLPRVAGGAALEGAAQSALSPVTEDESRLQNMALGGVVGGALPLALKAGGRLSHLPGRLVGDVRTALGEGGDVAAARGAREVEKQLTAAAPEGLAQFAPPRPAVRIPSGGDPVDRLISATEQMGPPLGSVPGTPFSPTSAAFHGHEGLAQLEKTSRTVDAAPWSARDATEARLRWEHLDAALRGPEAIDTARKVMNELKPPYEQISLDKLAPEVAKFSSDLVQATQSAKYRTDDVVKAAVNRAREVIAGGPVDPEVLHGLRMSLTKGLRGSPGLSDDAVRAAKSDPYVLSMVKTIDDMMERASTPGTPGWRSWREAYTRAARVAEGAKAEERLRRRFVDERGLAARGTTGEPVLTPAALRQAVAVTRTAKTGPGADVPRFSPQAQAAVDDVLADLERAALPQRVASAAAMGNSATAHQLSRLAVAGLVTEFFATGGVGTAFRVFKAAGAKNVAKQRERQLRGILMDPEKLRAFVEEAAKRSKAEAAQAGMRPAPYGVAPGALAAQEGE